MKNRTYTHTVTATLTAVVVALGATRSLSYGGDADSVADAIRAEATRAANDEGGRPLPLAGHWTAGVFASAKGWAPDKQMLLIEQGHHLLPWFQQPHFNYPAPTNDPKFLPYYEGPLKNARDLRLPLAFVASQWERDLSYPPYFDLPPDKNPNVVGTNGVVSRKVSPFGPVEPWRELGIRWGSGSQMKMIQELYPDPPLVMFLSNNEHSKLSWTEVETSQRYLDAYGTGRDADFKRKVVADGWIERYRALQDGMREGLVSPSWRTNALFVGYEAFGLPHYGRWGGWPTYSWHSQGRIDPNPLMWDGGSPSYYTHDWNPSTDYKVWSPQVEFMNLVFMQKEAYELNPNFWVEISVWDGYDGPEREKRNPSPRALYRLAGQTYDATRYGGFVQFGMWLLRPRSVREYRSHMFPWENGGTWEDGKPYFMAIVDAVDRVYANATLTEFWRKGELVPNRAHEHPYQSKIPEEYKDVDRWFLLDASVNPQEYPWELFWEIKVFALALKLGDAPDRQWLVYTHSPVKELSDVKLTIPEYKDIAVISPVGGAFYLVDEKNDAVTLVQ